MEKILTDVENTSGIPDDVLWEKIELYVERRQNLYEKKIDFIRNHGYDEYRKELKKFNILFWVRQTKYWKEKRDKILSTRDKCEFDGCSSQNSLAVHHTHRLCIDYAEFNRKCFTKSEEFKTLHGTKPICPQCGYMSIQTSKKGILYCDRCKYKSNEFPTTDKKQLSTIFNEFKRNHWLEIKKAEEYLYVQRYMKDMESGLVEVLCKKHHYLTERKKSPIQVFI